MTILLVCRARIHSKISLQINTPEANIRTMRTNKTQGSGLAAARHRMLEYDLKGRGIGDPNVLKVMAEIPREQFVPAELQHQAYYDGPLSIGYGQTISQPYIVALMTEELRLSGDMEVLEIGTGSGYQTAILSKLAKKVYTVERIEELSLSAKAALGGLGITNVQFHVGDGSCGWPEKKSFDRAMITAAVPDICRPITEQLVEGGLLIAPVGGSGVQRLVLYQKKQEQISERFVCDVRFVRLIGEHGFED